MWVRIPPPVPNTGLAQWRSRGLIYKEEKILDTVKKGRITELKIITFLTEKGIVVSEPVVPCRYDLIVDINDNLYNIQIKTGRTNEDEEYIEFSTCSNHTWIASGKKKKYVDEIDFFATYFNDEFYFIPISECKGTSKKLRLKPTKNGQVKNICFAKDYTFDKIFTEL